MFGKCDIVGLYVVGGEGEFECSIIKLHQSRCKIKKSVLLLYIFYYLFLFFIIIFFIITYTEEYNIYKIYIVVY